MADFYTEFGVLSVKKLAQIWKNTPSPFVRKSLKELLDLHQNFMASSPSHAPPKSVMSR